MLAGLLLVLSGCAGLGYYAQAIGGHLALWRSAEPVDEALADPALPAPLRARLATAVAARDFAFEQLALPDNGSYRSLVRLDRPYVVWNVFVAPPLSLEPVESCFLVVGCLAYRGYYREQDARAYAAARRAEGHDVYVGGVAAYSTLGWFDDPILSTFLAWDDARIAEVVFHELAHQRLYVSDDTTFNESFATAVAGAGLELWLADRPAALAAVRAAAVREAAVTRLVADAREALASVYDGPGSASEKAVAKAARFADMQARYRALRADWDGDDAYDAWMLGEWNNAKLASVSAYHALAPAFRALIERHDGDFEAVYRAAEKLAALDPERRRGCLEALAAGGHPPGCG